MKMSLINTEYFTDLQRKHSHFAIPFYIALIVTMISLKNKYLQEVIFKTFSIYLGFYLGHFFHF